MISQFPVPEVLFQIDSAVGEFDALVLQQEYLLIDAAEGEGGGGLAEAIDDPVAWDDARLGVHVQGVAYYAAPVRIAREHGDLSVGRDLAARDLSDNVIDQFKGVWFFFSYHMVICSFVRSFFGKLQKEFSSFRSIS